MSAPTVANSGLSYVANGGVEDNQCSLATTCAVDQGLVIVAYGPNDTAPLTISDGTNTYIAATGQPFTEDSNDTSIWCWWVPSNAVANPTAVITEGGSGESLMMWYVAVAGANAASFVDQQNGVATPPGSAAGYLSNPVTPSVSNDLVLAFAGNDFTGEAFGVSGSGYSIIQSTTANKNAALATCSAPASGTATNPDWTNADGTSGGCSFTLAIEAAAASGASPIVGPNGAPIISNGNPLITQVQEHFGVAAALSPLAWIIERRQRLVRRS